MSLNIFDIGIVLLCLMFFIVGAKNGVIKEVFSLAGTIAVFVIAFMFRGILGNVMCIALPFFKLSGALEGITAINILLYQVIAFMLLFFILLSVYVLIMGISSVFQKLVNLTIILIPVSKLLGGVVCLVKGYIIMFVVFLLLMIPLKNAAIYKESKLVNMMLYETPVLSEFSSKITSPVEDIYSLANQVSKKKITSQKKKKKTVDIMLKYKVCDKDLIRTLIRKNKLTNIDDIESILKKY